MSRTPLYLSIAADLRERIRRGEWDPGDRLPNEKELAQELFISRVTLREALGLLERDGLIARKHGLGSFVQRAPLPIRGDLAKLEPFAVSIQRAGLRVAEEVLALEPTVIPAHLQESLGMAPGEQGYRLEMLRRMEDTPVIYSRDFIRPEVIDPEEFRRLGRNILDYLTQTGRTPVTHARMTAKAVLPKSREQEALKCSALEPLLELVGVATDAAGRALYVTHFYIRTEHYELTLDRR